MTNRERAMNILHYKNVDRMPAVHFGYWRELLLEWAEQGKISEELARRVGDGNDADRELDKIIGWDFNWYRCVGGVRGLSPRFERKELETLPDGSIRVQNPNGIIEKIKPGINSIPSEDDYLLKDRDAFEELFKPKMQYAVERAKIEYFNKFNETRPMDIPVGLHLGSVLGEIRDMVSVVGMSYLMYDEDEELFADIIDTYADMQYQVAEAILSTGAKFDFACGGVYVVVGEKQQRCGEREVRGALCRLKGIAFGAGKKEGASKTSKHGFRRSRGFVYSRY